MDTTIAQAKALKEEYTRLSGLLSDRQSQRRRLLANIFRSALRRKLYVVEMVLRKPQQSFHLWYVALLLLGPATAATITFILLSALGLAIKTVFIGTIITSVLVLVIIAYLTTTPATQHLPGLITFEIDNSKSLRRSLNLTNSEIMHLSSKTQDIKSSIQELLSSNRLKRELLLKQNWKAMRGIEWEQFLVKVFQALGASAQTTRTTGDQGVDLIVKYGPTIIAVQAKGYSGSVGNDAVQQAIAGKLYYRCHRAVVITNSYFTKSAQDLANSTSCFLIGEQEFPGFVLGDNQSLFQ